MRCIIWRSNDRVKPSHSAQFVEAIHRVAAGGTAIDPEVIARLLARNTDNAAAEALSPREGEVLGLMAEGRSNAAIAQPLVITERAVAKHTASIFRRLGLQRSDDDNRRVLAVLAYLGTPGPLIEREGPGSRLLHMRRLGDALCSIARLPDGVPINEAWLLDRRPSGWVPSSRNTGHQS